MGNIADDALRATQLKKAVRLRSRGAHWNEVAEACGYPSPAAALRAVSEAMRDATARAEQTADDYRNEAELRLSSLLRDTLDMLDYEDPERDDRLTRLRAVDEARRLIADLGKIQGIDKIEAEPSDALKVQIVGLTPEDLI
jgi:hypothetical protein